MMQTEGKPAVIGIVGWRHSEKKESPQSFPSRGVAAKHCDSYSGGQRLPCLDVETKLPVA